MDKESPRILRVLSGTSAQKMAHDGPSDAGSQANMMFQAALHPNDSAPWMVPRASEGHLYGSETQSDLSLRVD